MADSVGAACASSGISSPIPLLIIAGPTASGKTALAVALCQRLGGEVVSADSMQIYRGMEIATAKPTAEELRAVPHHLTGIVDPRERFSVAQYIPLAHAAIGEIHARGKLPVLCGGTGLYIQAVAEGLRLTEGEVDHALRSEISPDWQTLHEIDPLAAARIHPNDGKRIVRALELYYSTGVTLTQQNECSRQEPSPYKAKLLYLHARDRQNLYDRIDLRVDQMLANGLLEEAENWRQGAVGTAAQAIGYKELEPYFLAQCPLGEAAQRLKQETRRYAKRQLSWFRRMAREWNERAPGSCVELYLEDEDLVEQALKEI